MQEKCGKPHHTLLHYERATSTSKESDTKSKEVINSHMNIIIPQKLGHPPKAVLNARYVTSQKKMMLATATVKIHNLHGHFNKVRALIDPGSETSFLTESVAHKLKLKREPVDLCVAGVGGHGINHIKHKHGELELLLTQSCLQV